MTSNTSRSPHLPQGYCVRLAEQKDCALLPAMERAAAELYRPTGLMDFSAPGRLGITPLPGYEAAQRNGLLWVAATDSGEAVAAALCARPDGAFYLSELSVHPAHMRIGLGRYLTWTVQLHATERGLGPLYLYTFRDVPWNAPFYARMGFRELPREAQMPWMHRIERDAAQIMDISKRCFMVWEG